MVRFCFFLISLDFIQTDAHITKMELMIALGLLSLSTRRKVGLTAKWRQKSAKTIGSLALYLLRLTFAVPFLVAGSLSH